MSQLLFHKPLTHIVSQTDLISGLQDSSGPPDIRRTGRRLDREAGGAQSCFVAQEETQGFASRVDCPTHSVDASIRLSPSAWVHRRRGHSDSLWICALPLFPIPRLYPFSVKDGVKQARPCNDDEDYVLGCSESRTAPVIDVHGSNRR